MEWNDEMVLEFLQNYEAEPVIWDPKNVHHKKKHLLADAWRRLRSNLSFGDLSSVEDLKRKKDSLMAYYRIHLNKLKNSKKSGTGAEEAYKTNWFAFSTMHSFLAPLYECTVTNTEEVTEKAGIDGNFNKQYDHDESSSSSQSQTTDATPHWRNSKRRQTFDTPMKKKRQHVMPDLLLAKKQLDEAYSIIKRRAIVKKPEKMHECDLYTQLLAEKLKKLNEERRMILMHNIDNLVFQELMAAKAHERATADASLYRTTPSPPKCEFIVPSPLTDNK